MALLLAGGAAQAMDDRPHLFTPTSSGWETPRQGGSGRAQARPQPDPRPPESGKQALGQIRAGQMVHHVEFIELSPWYEMPYNFQYGPRVAGKDLPPDAQKYYQLYLKVEPAGADLHFVQPQVELTRDEISASVMEGVEPDQVSNELVAVVGELSGLAAIHLWDEQDVVVPLENWWHNTSNVKQKHYRKYQRNIFLQQITQNFFQQKLDADRKQVAEAVRTAALACTDKISKRKNYDCELEVVTLRKRLGGIYARMVVYLKKGDVFREAVQSTFSQNRVLRQLQRRYKIGVAKEVVEGLAEIGSGTALAATMPISGPTAILGIITAADGAAKLLNSAWEVSTSTRKAIAAARACYQRLLAKPGGAKSGARLVANFVKDRVPVFAGKYWASPKSCEEKLNLAWEKVAGVYGRVYHVGFRVTEANEAVDDWEKAIPPWLERLKKEGWRDEDVEGVKTLFEQELTRLQDAAGKVTARFDGLSGRLARHVVDLEDVQELLKDASLDESKAAALAALAKWETTLDLIGGAIDTGKNAAFSFGALAHVGPEATDTVAGLLADLGDKALTFYEAQAFTRAAGEAAYESEEEPGLQLPHQEEQRKAKEKEQQEKDAQEKESGKSL